MHLILMKSGVVGRIHRHEVAPAIRHAGFRCANDWEVNKCCCRAVWSLKALFAVACRVEITTAESQNHRTTKTLRRLLQDTQGLFFLLRVQTESTLN